MENGNTQQATEMKEGPVNVYISPEESNQLLPLSDDEDVGEFKADSSYARKKTVAKGCLDFALLMANTSQLKVLVQTGKKNDLYYQLVAMISISIMLQVATGVLLIVLGSSEPRTRKGFRSAENMNNASVILILLITVLNLLISSLGISAPR
ncbi:ninjurin-1-like [Babylonia areolata]|uniref:ninjurin-1-like n=1 Tax=Babylonia areolata TaxID=304850 RepID=UPI003FCFC472